MRPSHRVRGVAAATITVAALAIAGCGGDTDSEGEKAKPASDLSGLPADELLERAKAELRDSPMLTLDGEVTTDGEAIGVDLSYIGEDAADGTLNLDGANIKLRLVDELVYIKGDREFWVEAVGEDKADLAIEFIDERWMSTAAEGNEDFAIIVSRTAFFDDALTPDGKVSLTDPKTIDGVACLGIRDSADDEGILYVDRKTGRPVVLTGDDGELDFSYDKVDMPTKPAKDDVVDADALSQLGA